MGTIIRLATEDGVEGFGYASATPHMGSTAATLKAELELSARWSSARTRAASSRS